MPETALLPDVSLPIALKVVALLVVGLLLIPAFLAMGPIGWVAIGSMFLVGVVQVHRERSAKSSGGRPEYCPNCGAGLDDDVFATDEPDNAWAVCYCPDCGAPLEDDDPGSESKPRRANCLDCGAPNDRGDDECGYCGAEL